MSEEKAPKRNGTDPLQRLASFKAPRDLSLGGVKPNKKVFTPNLNVSRNKSKSTTTTTTTTRENTKVDNGKERRNNRNKNKNIHHGPKIIKSSGVFSEGIGSSERHHSRSNYSSKESEPVAALQKPTIRVKDVIKIDKELEEQKINSVYGDRGASDNETVDFKTMFDRDAPVKLPMDDRSWSHQQKPKVKVKQEPVIKQEPVEDGYGTNVEEIKPDLPGVKPEVKSEIFENTEVVEILRSDKPTLLLLQLPDTLPGRGVITEEEAARRKANSEASTSTDEEKDETESRCRLKDLQPGRIGRLLVRRSGRVALALGDTVFEVCMGTKPAFYQEVVSLSSNHSSRSSTLVALGPVSQKLNLVPDWETMFQNIAMQ